MLALIKREIRDNLVYFIVAVIASGLMVTLIVSQTVFASSYRTIENVPGVMYTVFVFLIPFTPLACAALGATQMYSDRDKKIPALLSTLATTRTQILTAKIVTGLLWILLVLLPIAVADVILLKIFLEITPIYMGLLGKMFVATALIYLICYSMGLQMGWNQNKLHRILGTLAMVLVSLSIVLIKGPGIFAATILLLLAIASIVRTYQRFMSTSF